MHRGSANHIQYKSYIHALLQIFYYANNLNHHRVLNCMLKITRIQIVFLERRRSSANVNGMPDVILNRVQTNHLHSATQPSHHAKVYPHDMMMTNNDDDEVLHWKDLIISWLICRILSIFVQKCHNTILSKYLYKTIVKTCKWCTI